ncbi:hypothetical protein FRC19_010494 [Serendipita sp. 401]|nr:hypothetical protein FRC19_010494 [Serendipita sp. 401]KAG9058250.1 hypothetical protein FS842_011130 [Serendipita sp. 407]
MEPRRTQSAQAHIRSPSQPLPPGARQPDHRPYGAMAGLLSVHSVLAVPGQGGHRDRRLSGSSADLYAFENNNLNNSSSPSTSTYPQFQSPSSPNNNSQFAFPEPQLYRSSSANAYGSNANHHNHHNTSVISTGSMTASGSGGVRKPARQDTITPDNVSEMSGGFSEEYFDRNQYAASVTSVNSPERSPTFRTEVFAQLSLDQDTIKKFQEGKLSENDEEWHRLVDPEARAALPDKEVKRQSVLFEVIKSEKDYVADLELLHDVFLRPLIEAQPPIMQPDRINGFIHEVFWNFNDILARHLRLSAALFERQQDQHPIIQSIADIILEATLSFREDYESYIKHYPLAEARHRREMRRNPAYQEFLQRCTSDKRTKKRDLITFISRAVTRLPRLKLLLETVLKHTPEDHPDAEHLPIILGILGDFLKSTQPGIAAAESRVKFVSFCENVTFRKGELIDMDLYGENRTMVHLGTVSRKHRSDYTWIDLTAVLLDHYFILTREEVREEVTRYYVVSRPIPLDFLQLGPFIGPPESRRDATSENKAFLNIGIFADARSMYPFLVSDISSEERRYILYASSERERTKWKEVLEEAKMLRAAHADANKLFAFEVLSDDYMRERTVLVSGSAKKAITGLLVSATTFILDDRAYIVVATQLGVYVAFRSDPSVFTRILDLSKVTMITALPKYDRFFLLHNKSVISYSLRALTDLAQNRISASQFEKTLVKLTPKAAGRVTFFRVGRLSGKDMLIYDERSLVNTTIHTVELRVGGVTEINKKGSYVPAIVTDAQFLAKHLAVISDRGMTIIDPFNILTVVTVPDFTKSNQDDMMAALKEKCDSSKTLGIVPVPNGEFMCIYEEYGCYIHKHGHPTRKCGFVRWEIKANTFLFRAPYLLLFGDNFVEIRHAPTGQFRQMIQHTGLKLLEQTTLEGDTGEFLMTWKGEKNDEFGQSHAVVQALETRDLRMTSPQSPGLPAAEEEVSAVSLHRSISAISAVPVDPLWDEWS